MNIPSNRLINENSPYLLQHAHNPVDWYPWGNEALTKAKKENKLILVSIGYAACHWCHVMERETFENVEIAEILKESFISIKVDREERPDIDQIYMSAVQLMTGSGGWPLNCFLTPDAKPFHGGSYFPPKQFTDVIEQLRSLWKTDESRVLEHAENLCQGIIDAELITGKNLNPDTIPSATVYKLIARDFDCMDGGMNRVPKFPMPGLYRFLLLYAKMSNNKTALQHAELTAEKIIRGGIYDQLAGGISRYSTDRLWFAPHFEKMLYDNAQFVSLLSDLISITKKPVYSIALNETINFLNSELRSPDGGYYSSLDADSEGEEGKFYVWTEEEIKLLSGENQKLVIEFFGVEKDGNWEQNKNILTRAKDISDIPNTHPSPGHSFVEIIEQVKQKMLEHRNARSRPARDEKILCSWNALMISGLVDAWNACSNDEYLKMAETTASFLTTNMISSEFKITRSFQSTIPGFLDDYAFTAQAFIDLYQASFDVKWLQLANGLTKYCIEHFFDAKTGMFFYSPDTETSPVARQSEISDSVIPSSNSAMSLVLYYLSAHFDNPEYLELSEQMLRNTLPLIQRSPSFLSNWARRLILSEQGSREIVFTGKDARKLRHDLTGHYIPLALIAGSDQSSEMPLLNNRFVDGKSLIYVCKGNICKQPVLTIEEALILLEE